MDGRVLLRKGLVRVRKGVVRVGKGIVRVGEGIVRVVCLGCDGVLLAGCWVVDWVILSVVFGLFSCWEAIGDNR